MRIKIKEIIGGLLGIIPIIYFLIISGPQIPLAIRKALGQSSLDTIEAILTIISLSVCLFVFFLIPTFSRSTDEDNEFIKFEGIKVGKLYKYLLLGVLSISVTFGIIIYFGNPRRFYKPHTFPSLTIDARYYKFQAYSHLDKPPDILLFSSSVGFLFSPYKVHEETGYTAFNWATEAGGLADFITIVRYITTNDQPTSIPMVMLLEVTPSFMYFDTGITGASLPSNLLPYMDPVVSLSGLREKIKGLFNHNQAMEALYIFNAYFRGKTLPKHFIFDKSGSATMLLEQNLINAYESRLQIQINQKAAIVKCNQLDSFGVNRIEELISLSQKKGFSIIFYFAPRNPVFYEAVIEGNAQFNHCKELTYNYLQEAHQKYSNIYVLDFTRIESFSGLPGVEGFYDSIHMTPENSNRFISAAAPTIVEAYQAAEKLRNSP